MFLYFDRQKYFLKFQFSYFLNLFIFLISVSEQGLLSFEEQNRILEEEYLRRCQFQKQVQLAERDILSWMRRRNEEEKQWRKTERRKFLSWIDERDKKETLEIGRRRYKQYTPADMEAALHEVAEGNKIIATSRKFRIPSRTLYDRVRNKRQRRSQQNLPAFSETFQENTSILSDIDLQEIDLDVDVEPFDMLELVIDIDE